MSHWLTQLFRKLFSRTSPQPGKPVLSDDVDAEMRDVFLAEFEDLCTRTEDAFKAWNEDFSNPTHSRNLARAFHTLKGSAPILGIAQLAELGRAAEKIAKQAGLKRNPDLPQVEALSAATALMPQWFNALRHNLPAPEGTQRVIKALQKIAK